MIGEIDFSKKGTLGFFQDGHTNLNSSDAYHLASEGVAILDLREAYETNFRVFAVKNVLYLAMTSFRLDHGWLPKDQPLILADAVGIYSKEAMDILKAEGWWNLANMVGGMIDWFAEELPVRKDAEYELGGQCACKIRTRHGGNPLKNKSS